RRHAHGIRNPRGRRQSRGRGGRAHDPGARGSRSDDHRDAALQHTQSRALSPAGGCSRRLVGASVRALCHRRRPCPGSASSVVGGRTWSRAPSSGFRTRRATASSSAKEGTTSSSTSPRSRWTASRPSPKASVWSSRSSRVPRVPRPRTSWQRADRTRIDVTGGLPREPASFDSRVGTRLELGTDTVSSMAISRDEVLHVAKLAQLALTDEEVERLGAELDKILDAVGVVAELELDDVPPTSHPLDLVNVSAEDALHES